MTFHPRTSGAAFRVEDLTVAYNSKPALWDIDLEIPPGLLVGIVGPNGAGKSTLIKAAINLLPKAAGSVEFFDQPYERVRDRVGYVPQRGSVDCPGLAIDDNNHNPAAISFTNEVEIICTNAANTSNVSIAPFELDLVASEVPLCRYVVDVEKLHCNIAFMNEKNINSDKAQSTRRKCDSKAPSVASLYEHAPKA